MLRQSKCQDWTISRKVILKGRRFAGARAAIEGGRWLVVTASRR